MSAPPPPQDRPFGLTLMAALNLGFGLFNLGAAVQCVLGIRYRMDPSNPPGFDVAIATGLMALPMWFMVFALVASLVKAGLLFTSGWGYFNFKRVAGRYVGSAYALVSLVESAIAATALPYGLSGGAAIGTLYAVFTLLALNSMFKAILIR